MQTLIILGRQPKIGLAELESLYGSDKLTPVESRAVLIDKEPAQIDFSRLGGMVKFCKVITKLDTTGWQNIQKHLLETAPHHLNQLPEGKLKIGLSVYGLDATPQQIIKTGLGLKKVIQKTGRSARLVPNVNCALNAAQVLHNNLNGPLGWELVFVQSGGQTIMAQTIAVQDIAAYARRDQARPKRDTKVGMLPPKLAQTILNLAVGYIGDQLVSSSCEDGVQGSDEQRSETYKKYDERVAEVLTKQSASSTSRVASSASKQAGAPRMAILDPFCGTGVILQETVLMGYNAYGSDIEPRMVEYAKTNMSWLSQKYAIAQKCESYLEMGDATNHTWEQKFDAMASEVYLGRPLSSLPQPDDLGEIVQDVNTITKKFLKNLAGQTKPGFRLALALPAWKTPSGFMHLPLLDSLEELGYNRVSFVHASNEDLIYFREGQIVGRELLVLQRL